jgi:8-amino-7-oxononanoate synthase
MQAEGEVDEAPDIPEARDSLDFHTHEQRRLVQTSTDVFAKVREHERSAVLAAAREADVLPYFHVLTSPAMPVVEMEGAQRIMLGSNNYLGLTGDERVLDGAQAALHRYGTGLTGSRLLNGTIPLHLELERELAEWMETEDALVFSTGHQANVGTLGTLLGPGDTVIVDAGDHASILDGCVLSRAKLRPFRHNRMDKLEKMLQRAATDGGGVLVVVDGVFSMEGDIAPLGEICDLCERYGARLLVDEAHGAGVLGARGAGAAELLGVSDRVDLRVGTFSKSLASCGGFVAGPAEVIDYLRISSRAFLFTASSVPAAVGAALAALRVLRSDEGTALLAAALENARFLRDGLEELGFAVVQPQTLVAGATGAPVQEHAPGVISGPDGKPQIVTPIVPVLVGDDWKAALLWRALYDAGVFVNTALHPAVPPGGALIRTSVMATHDRPTLERALQAFAEVKLTFEAEHGALPQAHAHPPAPGA